MLIAPTRGMHQFVKAVSAVAGSRAAARGLALCPWYHLAWVSVGTPVGPGKDTHGTLRPDQREVPWKHGPNSVLFFLRYGQNFLCRNTHEFIKALIHFFGGRRLLHWAPLFFSCLNFFIYIYIHFRFFFPFFPFFPIFSFIFPFSKLLLLFFFLLKNFFSAFV